MRIWLQCLAPVFLPTGIVAGDLFRARGDGRLRRNFNGGPSIFSEINVARPIGEGRAAHSSLVLPYREGRRRKKKKMKGRGRTATREHYSVSEGTIETFQGSFFFQQSHTC